MPKIDFSNVDDVQDFSPLPDGKYLCQLSGIEEATTQNGDEMWKLRFEVVQEDHIGRLIFDNMVFSEAALKRVKLICVCRQTILEYSAGMIHTLPGAIFSHCFGPLPGPGYNACAVQA